MKRFLVSAAVVVFCLSGVHAFAKESAKEASGEELFKKNCSPCHPEGGNIVKPELTLHKKDREAHGVKRAADIIGKMRNPGPDMTKFDKETISDKDAKKIAEYILKTFK